MTDQILTFFFLLFSALWVPTFLFDRLNGIPGNMLFSLSQTLSTMALWLGYMTPVCVCVLFKPSPSLTFLALSSQLRFCPFIFTLSHSFTALSKVVIHYNYVISSLIALKTELRFYWPCANICRMICLCWNASAFAVVCSRQKNIVVFLFLQLVNEKKNLLKEAESC